MKRSIGSRVLRSGKTTSMHVLRSRYDKNWDRCTTMQVYDLAWSPTGEYILAGSTDNCARVFSADDGEFSCYD
jgi:WD40 repeat protein